MSSVLVFVVVVVFAVFVVVFTGTNGFLPISLCNHHLRDALHMRVD